MLFLTIGAAMATDIRIRIQPVTETGVPEGAVTEITYPMPEDSFELDELSEYLRGDMEAALKDYLPGA